MKKAKIFGTHSFLYQLFLCFKYTLFKINTSKDIYRFNRCKFKIHDVSWTWIINNFYFTIKRKRYIVYLFIIGTLLFSLSILILSFQSTYNLNFGWLGPLTPLGGSLLICGWILLLYSFIREK